MMEWGGKRREGRKGEEWEENLPGPLFLPLSLSCLLLYTCIVKCIDIGNRFDYFYAYVWKIICIEI